MMFDMNAAVEAMVGYIERTNSEWMRPLLPMIQAGWVAGVTGHKPHDHDPKFCELCGFRMKGHARVNGKCYIAVEGISPLDQTFLRRDN